MTIINVLRSSSKATCESGKDAALKALQGVFNEEAWGIDADFNYYSDENVHNLWNNELRNRVKQKLVDAGREEGNYKNWLGDVHFLNIGIYKRSLFERYRSNAGWRIVLMAIPRAGAVVVGIASHYQNAQNHNRLGEVSNLLFEVVREAVQAGKQHSMFGRRVSRVDWDQNGLLPVAITSIDSVEINDVAPDGVFLKDFRTTTLKKILASFITMEVLPSSVSEDELIRKLTELRGIADYLASNVYPFRGLDEFETFRALALQDMAAAKTRLQLRKKSSTRSVVRVYYGPPGTGKTLTAIREAVKLVEPGFNDSGDPTLSFERFNEHREQCAFVTFHPSLQYEDLVESIRPIVNSTSDLELSQDEGSDYGQPSPEVGNAEGAAPSGHAATSGTLSYRVHEGILLRMIRRALQNPGKEFAIVIDEINRGDLSRILGPLISTLEADKRVGAEFPIGFELQYPRAEELESRLFMPANLHLIGTMNSSDRNIALVDHALRRRFDFVEVPPEPALLKTTSSNPSIDCSRLLQRINERIAYLIDADHCIGHGYFMGCDTNAKVVERIALKVIPLLREYFYGNEGLLSLVLGGAPSEKHNIFKKTEPSDEFSNLFSVDEDTASDMGYRPHTTPRNLRIDERFWDASQLVPGPKDEDYAVNCILQIYRQASIEQQAPSSPEASPDEAPSAV